MLYRIGSQYPFVGDKPTHLTILLTEFGSLPTVDNDPPTYKSDPKYARALTESLASWKSITCII